MSNKVTVQDIANELGVSRNTVSKALNNTGVLAEKTRQRVLQKAQEMGYKQFFQSAAIPPKPVAPTKELAFFTHAMPDSSHFAYQLINIFQKQISLQGYRLSIYIISNSDYASLTLPRGFSPESCSGILCAEIFDRAYTHFLCSLGLPLLFADTYAMKTPEKLNAHVLYMENRNSMADVVWHLLCKGCRHIGFVGDIDHCHSFYERWLGYRDAMTEANIGDFLSYCILADEMTTPFSDVDWMVERIQGFPSHPDALVCANDFYASDVLRALARLGLRVPQDILLTGYDDSRESRIMVPALTTIRIPEDGLGYMASAIMLSKIRHPESPYSVTYVHTEPVFRESTRDVPVASL